MYGRVKRIAPQEVNTHQGGKSWASTIKPMGMTRARTHNTQKILNNILASKEQILVHYKYSIPTEFVKFFSVKIKSLKIH